MRVNAHTAILILVRERIRNYRKIRWWWLRRDTNQDQTNKIFSRELESRYLAMQRTLSGNPDLLKIFGSNNVGSANPGNLLNLITAGISPGLANSMAAAALAAALSSNQDDPQAEMEASDLSKKQPDDFEKSNGRHSAPPQPENLKQTSYPDAGEWSGIFDVDEPRFVAIFPFTYYWSKQALGRKCNLFPFLHKTIRI